MGGRWPGRECESLHRPTRGEAPSHGQSLPVEGWVFNQSPSHQGSAFSVGGGGEGYCYSESRSTAPPTVGAASREDLEDGSDACVPHGSLLSLRLVPSDTPGAQTGPAFPTPDSHSLCPTRVSGSPHSAHPHWAPPWAHVLTPAGPREGLECSVSSLCRHLRPE